MELPSLNDLIDVLGLPKILILKINTSLIFINKTPTGCLLLSKLHHHLLNGCKLKIVHTDPYSLSTNPKIIYNPNCVTIVIPIIYPKIKVQVIKIPDNKIISDKEANEVANGKPSNEYIDWEEKNKNHEELNTFLFYERMPFALILAHELIHCLRYWEQINDPNDLYEEIRVIRGIKSDKAPNGDTLSDGSICPTENRLRVELGKSARTEH